MKNKSEIYHDDKIVNRIASIIRENFPGSRHVQMSSYLYQLIAVDILDVLEQEFGALQKESVSDE